MSKHTPGPWNYKPTSGFDYGSTIYWIPGICTNVDKEADARLIASAPELLAALQLMLEQFTGTPSTVKDSEARIKAHAAIAKATENAT